MQRGEAIPWRELPAGSTRIGGGYWGRRRAVNRDRAIFYQWERYEATGTIDNFRIAAGLKTGERRGFFYSDSDLHKWADAASRILRSDPSPRLEALLGEYVGLMSRAQEPDGYLFTYNQIHFPGVRWKNLMIEHELYCLGHFIEAGVSRFEASGSRDLLDLSERAADLVVENFRVASNDRTSGHEEIEIALLRLYRATRTREYLDTATALLERRGRIRFFGPKLVAQLISQASRSKAVVGKRPAGGGPGFELGENLGRREPPFIALRSIPIFLGGSYQQQDRPLRAQVEPRGHAVRWSYLVTAASMLCAETGDDRLRATLHEAWTALVDRKMYVTGGIGALPVIEGFGSPYELDNAYSYSETCAAIGSVLWNREMSLSSPVDDARHADLVEWQLYNAAAVGISPAGDEYFYRNPLASDGDAARRSWFATPCCPSNLSRLWADLDRFAIARAEGALRIDQYFTCSARIADGTAVAMESGFPWKGEVAISVETPAPIRLYFRVPGWAGRCRVRLDGVEVLVIDRKPARTFGAARFASATYEMLALETGNRRVQLDFDMPVNFLGADPKVRCDRGRVAIVRGPLVYCVETVDNPGIDLDSLVVEPAALRPEPDHTFPDEEIVALVGLAKLIPYSYWGNRGRAAMRVFLRCDAGPRFG